MAHIDVSSASSQLEKLIERVAKGEVIVITKASQPIALLSPAGAQHERLFGSLKGLIAMSDDFDAPLEEMRAYQE